MSKNDIKKTQNKECGETDKHGILENKLKVCCKGKLIAQLTKKTVI